MTRGEAVGIVGASGDLGRQLTVQAGANFETVLTYDINPQPLSPDIRGIDASIRQSDMLGEPVRLGSLGELLDKSSIVHWCVAPEAVEDVPETASHQMLVLHASVMELSKTAIRPLLESPLHTGEIAIVHLLMNGANRAVVAEESQGVERIVGHMDDMGLSPLVLPSKEHDAIMARSQGPMAILHELLATDLAQWSNKGLLTPSGERFQRALSSSVAHWTPATYETIRHNPELLPLLEQMFAALNGNSSQSTELDQG